MGFAAPTRRALKPCYVLPALPASSANWPAGFRRFRWLSILELWMVQATLGESACPTCPAASAAAGARTPHARMRLPRHANGLNIAPPKGSTLPAPRALEEILRAGIQPNEVIVNIPLLLDSRRPVRADLSLDAALLEDIDKAAKARGLSRSGFMASAAREKILAEASQ